MNKQLENKLTGWQKSKIVSFCPTEEELLKITGEAELEKELNYTFENKTGNRCAILDFYISDINDENIFKYTIYLEDKEKTSKNGSNLYVNQIGDSMFSNSEDNLWTSFKEFIDQKWNNDTKKFDVLGKLEDKEYHHAKIGEVELLSLLKSCSNKNPKDINTNYFVDLDKIFDEDFSELKELIQTNIPVFCSFVYINTEFEQKLHNTFLPLNLYQQACSNIPDKYSKSIFANFYKTFEFAGSDDFYYNFGKLQLFKEEFLKNVKELNDWDSEY